MVHKPFRNIKMGDAFSSIRENAGWRVDSLGRPLNNVANEITFTARHACAKIFRHTADQQEKS